MALLVAGILGVMTMRSCNESPASSPSNPVNVARNGVAGVCANRQAVADAGAPEEVVPQVTLPPDLATKLGKADPNAAALMQQATSCPTATTAP